MTESWTNRTNYTKDLFFGVCNFHEFIFLGLIFPGIYFFGYPKKCLGRAPLSCTCQSTLPGKNRQVFEPNLQQTLLAWSASSMTSQLGTHYECTILLFTSGCKTSEMKGEAKSKNRRKKLAHSTVLQTDK